MYPPLRNPVNNSQTIEGAHMVAMEKEGLKEFLEKHLENRPKPSVEPDRQFLGLHIKGGICLELGPYTIKSIPPTTNQPTKLSTDSTDNLDLANYRESQRILKKLEWKVLPLENLKFQNGMVQSDLDGYEVYHKGHMVYPDVDRYENDCRDDSDDFRDFSDIDSEDGDMDFTACSLDDCGYCGKCMY